MSIRPARPVTTRSALRNIERRLECEAARLGPAGTAVPLAAGGAHRVQLVVGRVRSHELAHLVRLRDPDSADLPLTLGFRRKLDRALYELHPRATRGGGLPSRQMDRQGPHATGGTQR